MNGFDIDQCQEKKYHCLDQGQCPIIFHGVHIVNKRSSSSIYCWISSNLTESNENFEKKKCLNNIIYTCHIIHNTSIPRRMFMYTIKLLVINNTIITMLLKKGTHN